MSSVRIIYFIFFFNDTATTEIYTLSLHDALPISVGHLGVGEDEADEVDRQPLDERAHLARIIDRKSTRLNSSHGYISYAVFCLKKKKKLDLIRNNLYTLISAHDIHQ